MKIIIVGGVAGGASIATRLRRLDESAEIILVERGENISYATCGLPYYIGGVIEKRDSLLVQTPAAISKRFKLDLRTLQEVQKVIPHQKEIEIKELSTGKIYRESYDYLLLSPGASPLVPPLPGVELGGVFTLRSIQDSEEIKAWLKVNKAERAVVVGGGFVGLEVAENFKQLGLKVALLEAADQVLAPLDKEMASFLHKQLRDKGVTLFLNEPVVAFEGAEKLEAVVLKSGKRIEADIVVLAIGVKPETKLAVGADLKIGTTGGILVDEYFQTSDPNIYALGDAVEVVNYVSGQKALIPLAGPAQKQARIAADKIMGRAGRGYQGTLGTAIVKVFDLVAAATGLNEKTLKKLGIPYFSSYTHPEGHAGYYPGASKMCIKLLFAPRDGKILGAQIVGSEGVDKRIDVLATCIRKQFTVDDLQELELAYAPPFSTAKDPAVMAGYVACNILQGDVEIVHWHELEKLKEAGALIVDIREPQEVAKGSIPGSIKIPLNDLRSRRKELPKDKTLVLYCKAGLRSYLGYRLLKPYGYQVKSLSGGYLTYKMSQSSE
jgi:NADPH-dependent 2,4-dienoyl-CoA reductase/sulfur reductase-like enzyme/rhodanese-related sulfurtransferase